MFDATVASLMSEPLLTASSDENAGELADAMAELEIRSVVVIDAACHPQGIITSTDYLRMSAAGVDPADTSVAEWMTEDVVTLPTDESIGTAAELMRADDISHLPIVDDDGEAVGIVSATDITQHVADGSR